MLVWGLDAAVVTFVAPHTLHARPLVVGPDVELEVVNRTPDVEVIVLVDGTAVGALDRDAGVIGALRPRAARCSRRCPSRRSSAATRASSASPDGARPRPRRGRDRAVA